MLLPSVPQVPDTRARGPSSPAQTGSSNSRAGPATSRNHRPRGGTAAPPHLRSRPLVDCKQSLKLELDVPNRLCAAVFAAAVATAPVAARAMGDEEFVGPFPSWANVKTNYDAV